MNTQQTFQRQIDRIEDELMLLRIRLTARTNAIKPGEPLHANMRLSDDCSWENRLMKREIEALESHQMKLQEAKSRDFLLRLKDKEAKPFFRNPFKKP